MAYGPQYDNYPPQGGYGGQGYAPQPYPQQNARPYNGSHAQMPDNKKALHYTIDAGKNGYDPAVYDLGNPYADQGPPDSGYGSVTGTAPPPMPPMPAQPSQNPYGYSNGPPNAYGAPPPGAASRDRARSRSRGADPRAAPRRQDNGRLPQDISYANPYGAPDQNQRGQYGGSGPGQDYQSRPSGDRGRGGPIAQRPEEDYQVPGNVPGFFGGPSPEPYGSRPGTAPGRDAEGQAPSQFKSTRDAHYSTYGEEHIAYYTSAHAGTGDQYYDNQGGDNIYGNGSAYAPAHGPNVRPNYDPRSRGPPMPGRGQAPQGQPGAQRDMYGPSYPSDPGAGGHSNGPPARDPYGRPLPDRSRTPNARRGPAPAGMDPRRPYPPNDPRRRGPPGAGPYDPRDPRSAPRGPPGMQRDPRRPDYDQNGRSRSRPPGADRADGRRNRGDLAPARSDPYGPARAAPNAADPGNMPPRPKTAPGRRPNEQDRTMSPPNGNAPKPLPIRPGLQGSNSQPDRPPPVRQYPTPATQEAGPGPQPADSSNPGPVTQDDLQRARQTAHSRPGDSRAQLKLAKTLVEASKTLTDDDGRADPRTKETNRTRYTQEATKIIIRLTSAAYPDAMFFQADTLGSGALNLPNDPKEAFGLYQAAAKAGHAQAAYRTAVCCEIGPEEGGGTRRDVVKALQWYRHAAGLGDGPAMFKLGVICLRGLLDQPKNAAEGAKWLQQAAEKADEENPHALHELAILYEGSENPGALPRDETRALQLFTQGAKLGYRASQFRLGQAWEYGMLGCPIDARNSIIWYTRAAAQGEHNSELALSGWYLTGSEGILEHSDTEAYLWARKAAGSTPPLPKALFALGYFTEVGIGCPRSLEEAKRWYARAALFKFDKAQNRLDELKRGGSRVQKNRERLSRSNQKQQEAECAVM